MYLQQDSEICVMHAISPVHAGAGAATGAIDLPIQRERHSGWPHIQASGVKGAFREHCERCWMLKDIDIDKLVSGEKEERAIDLANRVFGQSGKVSQAGAIAFSDAKLLAFPVRSNLSPFVWVTCPAILKRTARDLTLINNEISGLNSVDIAGDSYQIIKGDKLHGELVLEDICLKPDNSTAAEAVSELYSLLGPNLDRLVLIPDDHFSYLMETATEIQAQIKIDSASGTTQDGSLRYQELLPADTVLYSVVFFGAERAAETNRIVLDTLREAVHEAAASHIQMGGDLTLGRGIFELTWRGGDK